MLRLFLVCIASRFQSLRTVQSLYYLMSLPVTFTKEVYKVSLVALFVGGMHIGYIGVCEHPSRPGSMVRCMLHERKPILWVHEQDL